MVLPARDRPYPRDKQRRLRVIQQDEQWVRSHIWALEDDAVRDLYQIMLQARGNMTQALVNIASRYGTGQAWSASDARFRERTDELLRQIDIELGTLGQQALGSTLDASVRAYQAGYYGRAWTTQQATRTGVNVSFARLPVEAIRAQILAPYRGLTFLDRFEDARLDFTQRIRRSMVFSQIEGEGIDQAARRLAGELGLDVSRRGNDRGLYARLEMISRTEILRASNAGARSVYEQNSDILKGFQAVVTHDERTCEICGPRDNRFYPLNTEAEMPPWHPRCRCTIVPAVEDDVLDMLIAGPREDYSDWAQRNGVGPFQDGGVFGLRGKRPPRSASVAAKRAAFTEFKNTREAREWAAKNFGEWEKSLSKEEIDSLVNYIRERGGTVNYAAINGFLRGQVEAGVEVRDAIMNLDQAIARGRIPENIAVFRGVRADVFGDLESLVGKTITDAGYISTTMLEDRAEGYAWADFKNGIDSVMVEMRLPAGYRGAFMENAIILGGGDESLRPSEYEILLPRGSRFKVTGITVKDPKPFSQRDKFKWIIMEPADD